MLSYEHKSFVITAQKIIKAEGDMKGKTTSKKDGYSIFSEIKLIPKKFSIIARYDHFDPDIDVKNNEKNRMILGVAYHLNQKNTILFDYDCAEDCSKDKDKKESRLQFTFRVKF
jgi:hypothetical protein